jgi:TonB family protein
MTRLFQSGRGNVWFVAALAAVCLLATSVAAQEDRIQEHFVSLDTATVSKLQLSSNAPEYPAIAKLNFIRGDVRIRIFVSGKGRVIRMHAIQGHPFLVVSAMEAIRNWTYEPYRIGKQARAFTTLVSVRFKLHPKVLTELPPAAEHDMEARVDPPKVAEQPPDPPSDNHVRLRVLVDSNGNALDTQLISGTESDAQMAERELSQWKFLPAHWGSLPVPWYVDIDVPVPNSPA